MSSAEPRRDGWAFGHTDRVRFGDLDAMRHLNNVAFLTFFESARIAFIDWAIGDRDPTDPHAFGFIFAECKVNYRSPAFFDEEIRTWVRPADLRRSSVRIEFEMVATGDGRLLAEGYGVLVGYDYEAGRAQPVPAALRTRLEPHLTPA